MGFRQEWEEQARKEGLEQGLERGLEQGLEKGRAGIVLKLLALRFGDLDEASVQRIRSASAESLDVVAERILTAHSLEEALADL